MSWIDHINLEYSPGWRTEWPTGAFVCIIWEINRLPLKIAGKTNSFVLQLFFQLSMYSRMTCYLNTRATQNSSHAGILTLKYMTSMTSCAWEKFQVEWRRPRTSFEKKIVIINAISENGKKNRLIKIISAFTDLD